MPENEKVIIMKFKKYNIAHGKVVYNICKYDNNNKVHGEIYPIKDKWYFYPWNGCGFSTEQLVEVSKFMKTLKPHVVE